MAGGDGVLTFLFTDVEGSTRLWEVAAQAMRDDLALHDRLLAEAVERHEGSIFKLTGDGLAAVFRDAAVAVGAAVAAQQALTSAAWVGTPLRVRMGLHSGTAQPRDGDWFGPSVNRAARLHAVAHGGQLVVSGVTAALVTPTLAEGITLRDLGEHRLRDLAEPERIHQVVVAGLPDRFPPLRTEHHPSRGVPAPTGRLHDRTGERDQLQDLVSPQRLVTITGPPGSGKTRLATELARADRDRWPGGVWFCSLASLPPGSTGTGGVAGRLADLLGSAASDGATALAAVVGALSDRRALVVLDGCDHVVDDAATVAQALRDGCPDTAVVVTSRERLDVPGEHLLDLPNLPDDHAVALFAERATAVRSGFALADHAEAVHALIARLDGLPLAIELAAARVRTHSPAEIDQLLGEQARVLRAPKRRERADDGTHHHDLEAAISWSHDLLDPIEQRVFRHLSVFAGPFTPTDVTAVLPDVDPADCTDALDGLVERSLVALAAPRPHDRTTRYRLLRTLRAYGRRRLDEHPDDAQVWDTWADVLAARVAVTAARLAGPDEARWVGEITDVWEDLRAVHLRLCTTGDTPRATRLLAPLMPFSTMRGLEVGEWAERTAALPGFWDQPDAPGVAAMAAEVLMRRTEFRSAGALATEAIARARPGSASPWLAHSTLCLVAYVSGDVEQGASRYRDLQAATAALRDSDPLAPAVSAFVAATLMTYIGIDGLLGPALGELDDLAFTTGSPSIEAMAHLARGRLLLPSDPAAARPHLEVALERAASVDNVLLSAQARWALAELAAADDPAGALRSLRVLLGELRSAGDEAQAQQALLATLGPLVSLGADGPALLVAEALSGWQTTQVHRAAWARLEPRADAALRADAARRAVGLGITALVDETVAAIDALLDA